MTDLASLLETFERDGFVLLPDVLSTTERTELCTRLQPYLELGYAGRNGFEGERTQRVYSLVGRGRAFERTAEHPAILELLDALLRPGYLLTASQAICIHPGETPQPLHFDDEFYTIPRPRPPVSLSTIWALDDFTAENGGTEVVVGSHRWSDADIAAAGGGGIEVGNRDAPRVDVTPVRMKAGSVLFFSGTLLHRGGANRAATIRRAMSHQYCEPWARQQENFTVSIPRERAAAMSPRLQNLLGYSIHPPFMGQLAGRHPSRSLDPAYVNSLVADDAAIRNTRD